MIKFKRGKGKKLADYALHDIYKFYKTLDGEKVPSNIFRAVLKDYNTKALEKVVYEGEDFELEAGMGSIRIRKFNNKPKLNKDGEVKNKFAVDWPETHKRWREIYPGKTDEEILKIPNKPRVFHLNEHTDNWVLKWHWDKITCTVPNQSAYRFYPVRTIKRNAAKVWKEVPGMHTKYYE